MIAARERLLEVRSERAARLHQLRSLLLEKFASFLTATDPVSGARLAEIAAEGSKQHGDVSVILAFFDGTRMRVGVDRSARFAFEVSPRTVVPDPGELLDVLVAPDGSNVQLLFRPPGGATALASCDVLELATHLLEHAVAQMEAEIPVTPAAPRPPVRVA
jgi:hypothetical protein